MDPPREGEGEEERGHEIRRTARDAGRFLPLHRRNPAVSGFILPRSVRRRVGWRFRRWDSWSRSADTCRRETAGHDRTPLRLSPNLTSIWRLVLLLLAPLAPAGIALLNTGLGRARSAAQALLGSLVVVAAAVLVFALIGATYADSWIGAWPRGAHRRQTLELGRNGSMVSQRFRYVVHTHATRDAVRVPCRRFGRFLSPGAREPTAGASLPASPLPQFSPPRLPLLRSLGLGRRMARATRS